MIEQESDWIPIFEMDMPPGKCLVEVFLMLILSPCTCSGEVQYFSRAGDGLMIEWTCAVCKIDRGRWPEDYPCLARWTAGMLLCVFSVDSCQCAYFMFTLVHNLLYFSYCTGVPFDGYLGS